MIAVITACGLVTLALNVWLWRRLARRTDTPAERALRAANTTTAARRARRSH